MSTKTRRLLVVAVVGSALLAGGILWFAHRSSHAQVVSESSSGWRTIEYHGVRVDVPASWKPLDTDGCEFHFERWAPRGTPRCAADGGLAFYASATFDPAHGPGVSRMGSGPFWGGYAIVDDYAVWASDDDRALVEKIVASAH